MIARDLARLKKEKLLRNLSGEMIYSVFFSLLIVIVLAVNAKSDLMWDKLVRKWLGVVLGYYLFEFIMQMLQYHFITKNGKENLIIMVVRFLGNAFLFGWLVYGNCIYFQKVN